MSVKDKIKIFQNEDKPSDTRVPGTPGKLDLSKFANFVTPRKTPEKMEMVTPREPPTEERPEALRLPGVPEEGDEENFVTPYSDRMSVTPEDVVPVLDLAEEEAVSPTVSLELNHRLRFLRHPPPPIY
jgi:hypothetical protein